MERTSSAIDDAEGLDFNEDLRGFPLDRRMGCEEPRERVGRRGVVDAVSCGVSTGERDSGDERGKGTAAGVVSLSLGEEDGPLVIARSSYGGDRLCVSTNSLAMRGCGSSSGESSSSSSLKWKAGNFLGGALR